jgi:hypothetical protein
MERRVDAVAMRRCDILFHDAGLFPPPTNAVKELFD